MDVTCAYNGQSWTQPLGCYRPDYKSVFSIGKLKSTLAIFITFSLIDKLCLSFNYTFIFNITFLNSHVHRMYSYFLTSSSSFPTLGWTYTRTSSDGGMRLDRDGCGGSSGIMERTFAKASASSSSMFRLQGKIEPLSIELSNSDPKAESMVLCLL